MKKSSLFILFLVIITAAFLRFYQLDKVPHGLYIDEASIGYNAYTILHTGKDEYGVSYPLFFRSFDDYKQPVYIYMTSAAMAVFGKNDFSVRFPSAFFGTLTVVILFLLVKELFAIRGKKPIILKNAAAIALIASAVLAISPWHIHFSRGGFEVNVGLFFYLAGIYGLLLFWNKKQFRFFVLALAAFIVTLYTYHTYKILTPLTWIIANVLLWFSIKEVRKQILLSTGLFFLACIPLVHFSLSAEGSMRFSSTSAFSEVKANTFWEKITIYPMIYLKNYLAFFAPEFLFSYGDHNGRHQVVRMGLLYKWELPFLLMGFIWLFKQKSKLVKLIIIGLLLGAPLIPAVAAPSPHTLRSLLLVIPLTILVAGGIYYTFINLKTIIKWIVFSLVAVLACLEFTWYIHKYYAHYPNINARDWGGGYKETVQKALKYHSSYRYILVDKELNFAPTYFHFYAPDLPIQFVDNSWKKPAAWEKDQVLYIRPFYGHSNDIQSIDQVYLPGPNKDVFAQFWKL